MLMRWGISSGFCAAAAAGGGGGGGGEFLPTWVEDALWVVGWWVRNDSPRQRAHSAAWSVCCSPAASVVCC